MFGQDELIYRADAVRQAWKRACDLYMEKSIVAHTTADFYQLAGGLITGMLPVLGIAVVGPYGTALAGTLIGACFGPAGAAIGADAGFLAGQVLVKVGLTYLGVQFLVEYILPRIGDAGSHIAQGIQLGWDAGGWGDVARARFIDMAAQHFAEGVGIFFSLLMQALVLRLAKAPGSKIAEFANSLLYRACPRLFAYLIANLERLRGQTVQTPAPRPAANIQMTGYPGPMGTARPAPVYPPPFYDFPEFRYRSYGELETWLRGHGFDRVKEERVGGNGRNTNDGSEIWVRHRIPGECEAVRIDRFGHELRPEQRTGPITLSRDPVTGAPNSEREGWGGVGHMHKESFGEWRLPQYGMGYVPEARTYSDNNTALTRPPAQNAPPATPSGSPYYFQQAHIPIRL